MRGSGAVSPPCVSVRRDGRITALEPKTLRVLSYLLDNCDRVVSKDKLIWAGTAVTDNAFTRVAMRKILARGQQQAWKGALAVRRDARWQA